MTSYLKQLSNDAIIYGVSGASAKLIGFLILPLLTRALSPEDYGVIDILTTVGGFLMTFMILGMNASLVTFFHEGKSDHGKCEVILTDFAFLVGWGALVGALAAITGPLILPAIVGRSLPYWWLLVIIGVSYFGAIRDNFSNLFRLMFRPWSYLLTSVGGLTVSYVCIIWLVIEFKQGVGGYFLGSLAGTLVASVLPFFYLINWFQGNFSVPLVRRMLFFAVPLVPTDIALWVISFSERFFIIRFLSIHDLGVYAVGARIASLILLGTYAFRLAWAPLALSIQNRSDANHFYALIDRGYKVGASLFVIVLTAVSFPLLKVLTPSEYHGGYQVVGFIAYGIFFSSIYWVSGLGVVLGKRSIYLTVAIVLSALVSIGLYAILTPVLGILGAAAAGALAHITGNMTVLHFSEKTYRIGLSNRITLLLVGWTFLALIIEVMILQTPMSPWGQIGLCLLVISASAVYLFLVGLGADQSQRLFGKMFNLAMRTRSRVQSLILE